MILFFSIFSKAIGSFNILNLDYDIGVALGIGEFAGGLLLMLIMTFAFVSLPLWKKNYPIATLLGIICLCFGIAVSWVNIFVLIIYIFGLGIGVAKVLISFLSEHGIGR